MVKLVMNSFFRGFFKFFLYLIPLICFISCSRNIESNPYKGSKASGQANKKNIEKKKKRLSLKLNTETKSQDIPINDEPNLNLNYECSEFHIDYFNYPEIEVDETRIKQCLISRESLLKAAKVIFPPTIIKSYEENEEELICLMNKKSIFYRGKDLSSNLDEAIDCKKQVAEDSAHLGNKIQAPKPLNKSIAVLLPLSGRYAAIGKIIKSKFEKWKQNYYQQKGHDKISLKIKWIDHKSKFSTFRKTLKNESFKQKYSAVITGFVPRFANYYAKLNLDINSFIMSNKNISLAPNSIGWHGSFDEMIPRVLLNIRNEKLENRWSMLYPYTLYNKNAARKIRASVEKENSKTKFIGMRNYSGGKTDYKDILSQLSNKDYLGSQRFNYRNKLKECKTESENVHQKNRCIKELEESKMTELDFDGLLLFDSPTRSSYILPTILAQGIKISNCLVQFKHKMMDLEEKLSHMEQKRTLCVLGLPSWDNPAFNKKFKEWIFNFTIFSSFDLSRETKSPALISWQMLYEDAPKNFAEESAYFIELIKVLNQYIKQAETSMDDFKARTHKGLYGKITINNNARKGVLFLKRFNFKGEYETIAEISAD